MRYNVDNFMDTDSEGAARVAQVDTDHDANLCGGVGLTCNGTNSNHWGENENPVCSGASGSSDNENCDTDDNFWAWAHGVDTADQDGASTGMLCFAASVNSGLYKVANLGDAGATVTVNVPSCTLGMPPSGTYTAWVQVYGVSGPAACTPGKRCSGLPTRMGQAADGVSAPFQIVSST